MAYYYEEYYNGLCIVEYKAFRLKKPAFMICGLPDAGLVGSIAVSHLINELKMEEIGGIESFRYFPPVAIVHKGEPKPVLRLFSNENILTVISEIPIPTSAIYPLAIALIDYAQKKGVDHIISPIGVGVPNRLEIERPRVYWIATSKDGATLLEKLNLKKFEEGFLVGPYAVILKECKRKRVSNIVLLVESFLEFPDPAAAAETLKVLSNIIGVEINVKPLIEKAEEIRLKTRELMDHTRRALTQMKKTLEYQLPLTYV